MSMAILRMSAARDERRVAAHEYSDVLHCASIAGYTGSDPIENPTWFLITDDDEGLLERTMDVWPAAMKELGETVAEVAQVSRDR